MSIANLVKVLLDAGVDDDVIVEAVAAVEDVIGKPIAVPIKDEAAERRRAYDRERKRMLRPFWSEVRGQVIARDGYVCAYCGAETEDPHIDHIHPLSKGGTNDLSNLTVSCPACNIKKGAKIIADVQQ